MVTSAAIYQGVGSARVVAHHAADAAAVACGGLGAEEEAVGLEGFVQFVAYHARLYPYPPFAFVKFQYAAKVAADIHDDAVAHHLTGDACAAGTRDEVGASAASLCYQLDDVILVFGVGDAERQLAIDGCVGGVGYSVETVCEDSGGHGVQR